MKSHFIKGRVFLGISLGVLVIILLLGEKSISRWLRPLYVAGITDLRVVYRGNAPIRFRIAPKDGAVLVYIPAGEFPMGSNKGPAQTGPVHTVYLDAYWMDQVEVTNTAYAVCVKDGACRRPARYNTFFDNPSYADYPVVYVNWYDAQAYCSWAGEHLPTEAQWEKAARGTDQRHYPWGNERPDNSLLNFNGFYQAPRSSYDYLTGASPYGLLNMSGNVQEWVADWYDPNYYTTSPYKNPQGPATGEYKILRGGGYWDNATEVQTTYRFKHDPNSAGEHRGIRCVVNAQ